MPLSPEDLQHLAARTLAHYEQHAQSYWEGTRGHDVSQTLPPPEGVDQSGEATLARDAAATRAAITIHPGSAGAPRRAIAGACGPDRVVDIVCTLPGDTAGRFPRIEVFEQTPCPDEFKEAQVLALHVHGPGMFHTAAKQVESAADLRGMEVRGPTRQVTKLLGSLGAIPLGMPLPQIPDALSKGTIEGCVIPWEVVPAVKVHELTKFHGEFPTQEVVKLSSAIDQEWVADMDKRGFKGKDLLAAGKALTAEHA